MLTVLLGAAVAAALAIAAGVWLRSDPEPRVTLDTSIKAPLTLSAVQETGSIGPSPETTAGADVVVPPPGLPSRTSGAATTGEDGPTGDPGASGPNGTPLSRDGLRNETTDTGTGTDTTEPTDSRSDGGTSSSGTSGTGTTSSEPSSDTSGSGTTGSGTSSSDTSGSGTSSSGTSTSDTSGSETSSSGTSGTGATTSRSVPSEAVPELEVPPIARATTDEREELYCELLEQTAIADLYVLPACVLSSTSPGGDAPADDETGASAAQRGRSPSPQEQAGETPPRESEVVQGQAAGAEAVDVIPYTHQDLVGQSGNPVPAQEAAQRLEMRLQQVRAQPHGQGPSAPGDPSPQRRRDLVGMSARISMDIEGLSGESLSLFWRLSQTSDAAALTGTWEKPTLACRLRPRTQTDSATVNVWIPLPQDPGPFVLDLLVTRDGDGAVVGSQRVKPVG